MKTFSQAMAEAARDSGMDDCEIAEHIGMSAGYFSKFSRNVGNAWAVRLVKFMRVTGSTKPLDWMAAQMGRQTVPEFKDRAAEVAALQARLNELTRAA